MNQTKKRLSIIKIAISITDIETIQLQILKLGLLKTDEKIQNILSMLQAENYAQAQGLITTYIETVTENVLQRSSQEKKHILTKEDQSTIDEFQLFVTPEKNEQKVEIDLNDFLSDNLQLATAKPLHKEKVEEIDINDFLSVSPIDTINPITPVKPTPSNKYDSLLNIDVNDVLTDNINLDISYTEDDNFFTLPRQENKPVLPTSDIPKDTFFDTLDETLSGTETEILDTLSPIVMQNITVEKTEIKVEETVQEENILIPQEEQHIKELPPTSSIQDETLATEYKSIPYIAQKLESMNTQYPSPHDSHETFPALTDLLTKISQETYSEEAIEERLSYSKELMEEQKLSQASQLLLVCAATPSPFAQLILARELYKGVLLTQNIPQAFILLNTLAMDDYPEALCDLGQFYENGIGTKKDKKRAQELYKNAMDFGIRRAKIHFERIKKQNKGFFRK